MASKAAEQAVRDYLTFIQKPAGKPDGRSKDVLDQLARLSYDTKAAELEAAFVTHASVYAAAEGTPVQAWQSMGVSDDVLRKAGLLSRSVSSSGRAATKKAGSSKPAAKKSPAKRTQKRKARVNLTAEMLLAQLPDGNFTKVEATDASGASGQTTAKRLKELVDAKKVKVVEAGGRGRGSASVYKKAR